MVSISNLALAKAELEPPTFSHDSGFYPEEFELTLSHPNKDVTIYYTLDGSNPDLDNLEGKTFRYKNEYAQPPATKPIDKFLYQEYKTYKYSKPIKIVDRTYEPDRLSQISTTLNNIQVKNDFIIRFSDLLNSTFKSERMVLILKHFIKELEPEIEHHISRWRAPKSLEAWNNYNKKFINFFEHRPKHQWQHLQEFFELDDFYQVTVDASQAASGKVKLNTLTLGDDPNKNYDVTDTPLFFPWRGQYFQNLPLTLEAIPADGYKFSHWQIQGAELTAEKAKQPKLVLKPTQNLKVIAVMEKL